MSTLSTDVAFQAGDEVTVDTMGGTRGRIESIRVIATASVVQSYEGPANNVVVTVRIDESFLNLRGSHISPVEKLF